jgi:hypothetical protein
MPQIARDTNLIIAGTNKSGTTAVFRYLGDHPDTALSKVKELQFFLTPVEDRVGDVVQTYKSQFLSSDDRPILHVEATPMYLHGGERTARRIASVVPDARILFILRNPTDRVISYFRSSYGQKNLPTYGVPFSDFVREGVRAMQTSQDDIGTLPFRQRAFRQEIRISRYVRYLPAFMETFGVDHVLVAFFDQLVSSPGELMSEICEFCGIDPHIYDDYVFRTENKTRIHRSTSLQTFSGSLNSRLEPFLNRFPSVRRTARGIYDLINVGANSDIDLPADSVQELNEFFAPWNTELDQWLRATYPGKSLPDWPKK